MTIINVMKVETSSLKSDGFCLGDGYLLPTKYHTDKMDFLKF